MKKDIKNKCVKLISQYIEENNLTHLINGLTFINQIVRNSENDYTKDIWFKFTPDDSLATTIDDIERDLSLPIRHSNHIHMVEMLIKTVEFNSLRVYFN